MRLAAGLDMQVDVVIAGAGPVGLALAIELGDRGIRVLLVEENERIGRQPRAKTTNVRTMQHLRRWGLAQHVRDAAPHPKDYPADIIFATRYFGRVLAQFHNAFSATATTRDERYPEAAQWFPQYKLEAIMRDRVMSLPSVTLRMQTRLSEFQQDADGVDVCLDTRGDGTRVRVRAAYLVGADGARSTVRKQLGISMIGERNKSRHCNVIVRAPGLHAARTLPRGIMYWLINPESPATFSYMDSPDIWAFGSVLRDGQNEPSNEELKQRIISAIGRETPIEILNVDLWAAHSLVAESYRADRVFLAGDACHLHPPYGGYGMNLGIGDAVDLGWKMASVLHGWGGDGLLDAYQSERAPVHRRVIEEAMRNHSVLTKDLVTESLEADGPAGESARAAVGERILATKSREFHTLGVVLGYHYAGSPLIIPDGTAPPDEEFRNYVPSASPGVLAPHAWLTGGVSLYDRFGREFTLLVMDPAKGVYKAASAMASAAAGLGLPLQVEVITDSGLAEAYGAPLALVRPDQHVAWRGGTAAFDPVAILRAATGQECRPGGNPENQVFADQGSHPSEGHVDAAVS